MSSKLHPQWISHLKGKGEIEQFALAVQYSPILDRLEAILKQRLEALDRAEVNEDYESPSWSHKQAHRNGLRQGIKFLEDLLTQRK